MALSPISADRLPQADMTNFTRAGSAPQRSTVKAVLSVSLAAATLSLAACASTNRMVDVASISNPAEQQHQMEILQASAPKPIEDNSGKFMSPFTSDGVTAEWVTKAMKVQQSGAVGQAAGQIAGDQLLSNIPLAGMFAGKAVKAAARSAALKSIGGEEFLKSSSDESFNSLDDMAANMYAFHALHPDYAAIVKATIAIYPAFAKAYARYPQPKSRKASQQAAK